MSVWNFLGNVLGLGYEVRKDQHLTGAQREANRFNASEAAKQRQFASAEAEAARAWQEHMYTEYESPQALMRQAKEAGINPAAVYGDALGGSAPSASAPSGASASSVTPSGGDVVGMVQALTNIKLAQAEIDYKKHLGKESDSKTALNKKQLSVMDGEISRLAADTELLKKELDVMDSDISLKDAQAALYGAQAALAEAEGKNVTAQEAFNAWRARVVEFSGNDPLSKDAKPMLNFIATFLSKAGGAEAMADAAEAFKVWSGVFDKLATDELPDAKPLSIPVPKD